MEGKELNQENIIILQVTETGDSFGERRNANEGQIQKILKANGRMARRTGKGAGIYGGHTTSCSEH